jgi:Trk K+ transport system NAD-binding subunit
VRPDVVVFGLGRYGGRLASGLMDEGLVVLGVDFDPEVVQELRAKGIAVRFGDGQDPAFLDSLPLEGVPWAVSVLPDLESNLALLHALSTRHFGGEVAIVARDEAQGIALKQAGAPMILNPFRNAVDFVVEHLTQLIRHERAGAAP